MTENSAVIGKGLNTGWLEEDEISNLMELGLDQLPVDGKRVLVIVPDHTRTMPLPFFFQFLIKNLLPRVQVLNFLIALGTHPRMSEDSICSLFGISRAEKASLSEKVKIYNHEWDNPSALTSLGILKGDELSVISQGMLRQDVPVRLNRLILDHDHLLICGPVFPHEVAGFSGGNKYFVPGIAGPDIINLTHWLGALITSYKIIGHSDTPVRQIIDRAAALIPRPRHAVCSVVDAVEINGKTEAKLAGIFIGPPEASFSAAAQLSARRHIIWCDHPYQRVLSILPEMYSELWVGAKGMYKLEPVIADAGEVIIYAPHLKEISVVHGKLIRQIGYHVRDYFLKQWDNFSDYPLSVLAHSTHLRGIGTYENGLEKPRIQVALATGIPEDICRKVNLGYYDPAGIHFEDWVGREDDGILMVPRAGEFLFKLKADIDA
jgi:nickel-dependent lactate racemase